VSLLPPPMPPGLRLVKWEPKEAPIEISPYETVIETEKYIESTLRQVDALLNHRGWLGGNWPLKIVLERLEKVGCTVELIEGESHAGTHQP
jgi:hypothetical protein